MTVEVLESYTAIEILETSKGMVEVIEAGPQGIDGIDGTVGADGISSNTVNSSTTSTLIIDLHDVTENTEYVVDFGTKADDYISITPAGLELLQDVSSFSSVLEIHTDGVFNGQSKVINFSIWVEVSLDGGTTWLLQPFSLHTSTIGDISSSVNTIDVSSEVTVTAGTKMRVVCTKTGSAGTILTIVPAPDLLTSKGVVSGDSTKATMFYKPLPGPVPVPAIPYISQHGLVSFV